MKKRILAWLLLVCMVLGMIPTTVGAANATAIVLSDGQDYTISSNGIYTVSGSYTDTSIIVPAGVTATLELNGLTLNSKKSPIQVQNGGNLTLIV